MMHALGRQTISREAPSKVQKLVANGTLVQHLHLCQSDLELGCRCGGLRTQAQSEYCNVGAALPQVGGGAHGRLSEALVFEQSVLD